MSTKAAKAPEAPTAIKVSDLAKRLGYKTSRELLGIIADLKIPKITNPSHTLTEGQADRVKTRVEHLRKQKGEHEEAAARATKAKQAGTAGEAEAPPAPKHDTTYVSSIEESAPAVEQVD